MSTNHNLFEETVLNLNKWPFLPVRVWTRQPKKKSKKSTDRCQQQVLKKDVRLTPPWKSQHAKRSKSDTDVLPLSGGDQLRCSSSAVQAKQPEKDVYVSDHKLFIFSSDLNRMALIPSGCVAKSPMSSRTSREDPSFFVFFFFLYKAVLLRAFLILSLSWLMSLENDQ